jgi:hypothetical protein
MGGDSDDDSLIKDTALQHATCRLPRHILPRHLLPRQEVSLAQDACMSMPGADSVGCLSRITHMLIH